jgi:hypothetical protein
MANVRIFSRSCRDYFSSGLAAESGISYANVVSRLELASSSETEVIPRFLRISMSASLIAIRLTMCGRPIALRMFLVL